MVVSFENKVALVTGGASGIGRATALAYGRAGARVVVADVQVEAGRETARLIEAAGSEAFFIQVDVSKGGEVEEMVRQTIAAFGRLDMAHNNAGIEPVMASIADSSETDWDRVVSINLKGIWLCLKHEIPPMLEQGGGAIVNTASVVGLLGQTNMASYVASKHGVIGLTRAAALEYAAAGIRVNAVCPAIVATPMLDRFTEGDAEVAAELTADYPMKRLIDPQEVADAVLWLSSNRASYLNGHALVLDGGFSIQ
jgi:NAD(P)-dependent dehydrogenase (short-subunit alcohol dehydrogenase family)